MTDQKHIEAAAAAYDKEGGMHVGAASIHRLRAAITAYHASLAAEGEDGLVEAMLQAYQWPTITPPNRATKEAMRAALGVVLAHVEARATAAEAEVARLREALQAIEQFGHDDGHRRGYTCANMRAAMTDWITHDGDDVALPANAVGDLRFHDGQELFSQRLERLGL